MSPRKSSTSSGKRTSSRPRYLGVEVAGDSFPSESPAAWHDLLATSSRTGTAPLQFRVIRSQGPRAIVAVDQHSAVAAREQWNRPRAAGSDFAVRTQRTWGTLVGAKAWLRQADRNRHPHARR